MTNAINGGRKGVFQADVKLYDFIFLGVLYIAAYLFMLQGDLFLTTLQSLDLLSVIKHGDFFNFYTIVLNKATTGGYGQASYLLGANYNILVYLILAVWVSPLKILSLLVGQNLPFYLYVMYTKLLILILDILSIFLIFKIANRLTQNKTKSKLIAYIFGTSAILLYGSTIYGQLDIICVVLFLWALLFYFDKKFISFCLIMSTALCIKGFAIFILVPLILLNEKRILHIFKYLAISFSFPLLVKLLFFKDRALTAKLMGDAYQFANKIWATALNGPAASISIFLLILIITCILCYYIKPDHQNFAQYSIFMPFVILVAFFTLVNWHASWVINIVPFICLSFIYINKTKLFLILDFFASLSYIAFSVLFFRNNADNKMINEGILVRVFNTKNFDGPCFMDYFEKTGYPLTVVYTVYVACLAGMLIVAYLEIFKNQPGRDAKVPLADAYTLDRSILLLRPFIVIGFIAISYILYFIY